MSDNAPTGHRADRIRRVARVMARATLVVAALQVVFYVLVFLDPQAVRDSIARDFLPMGTDFTLTPTRLALGFVIGLLPVALSLYGLWHASRLFAGFRDGAVFTEDAGRRLVRIGGALALTPLARVVTSGLGSVVASWGNAPGERVLMVSLSNEHVVLAVAGIVILTAGWVMAEAARIAAENESFV